MSEMKILLVEDNRGDSRLIEELFHEVSSHKFLLELAENLADAIATIKNNSFDIILLDLGLPDSQGINTIKKMSKASQNTPIIVLTGLDDESIGISAIKNGAQDYLIKGQIEANMLVRVINYCVERWQIQNNLRDSEEKYKSIVDNSPDIIMRVDKGGKINFINNKYCQFDVEDIIGKTIYDLMPSETHSKARDSLKKVFTTRISSSYENLALGKDNEVLWYLNNVGAIKENNKVIGATITARDITSQKQIDVMKNEFISSVSHELRTPLAIIRESLAQVLEGFYGETTLEIETVLKPCIDDADRLTRIIDNLLDISKIEALKIALNRNIVDIVKLARDVLLSFNSKADNKNLTLKFISSDEKIDVYIDKDRIIQVLVNLIGNSMKFTQKGKIQVSIIKSENTVKCIVSDTGRGIEHKDLATVFDRFHQVGKTISGKDKGTGLGLSISKGIIELHNGEISVDSQINKGSQFEFTLPIYTITEIIKENIDNEIITITEKHVKLSLFIIRLENFEEIQQIFDINHANNIINKMYEIFQVIIAPGEFSLIVERNEIVFFSDTTKKSILPFLSNIENIMENFILNNSKKIIPIISYGYSSYPIDATDATNLLEIAYKMILNKNHK